MQPEAALVRVKGLKCKAKVHLQRIVKGIEGSKPLNEIALQNLNLRTNLNVKRTCEIETLRTKNLIGFLTVWNLRKKSQIESNA